MPASAVLARTIIDLRPAAEREQDPLIPLRREVVGLSLEQIEDGQHALKPEQAPFLVACRRGTQAALAARYLRSDGLEAQAWAGTWAELTLALTSG